MIKPTLLLWGCVVLQTVSAQTVSAQAVSAQTVSAQPVSTQDTGWQQRVDTRIEVSLDDVGHVLHGAVTLNYVNTSPDTLPYIYFHLYPNAYKTDRTAYAIQAVENGSTRHYFSAEADRGYIDSLDFSLGYFGLSPDSRGRSEEGREWVPGEHVPEEFSSGGPGSLQANDSTGPVFRRGSLVLTGHIDVARLDLPSPLLPGDSLLIHTPFRVKIPKSFSRLGHVGQSYQISQWFPKPAVYDTAGWHPLPYLDQGEFYGEFGAYEVTIDVPVNYIVMASGDLPGNSVERDWLDSLSRLPLPADTLFSDHFPPSSDRRKRLHFSGAQMHDFAWFADKRWVVRIDTVAIPGSTLPVTAYVCYLPSHQVAWAESMEALRTALVAYSEAVGPYPYGSIAAVEGGLSAGGGMEYPGVTVIAPTRSAKQVKTVIIHEAGHNWFYGILGSNERAYPWLDEGLNSFYERKFDDKQPAEGGAFKLDETFLAYASFAGLHRLLPADTHSAWYPMLNYGVDIYYKVPLYLEWLEAYMGQENFRQAMQEYYRRYRFRHPRPEDFERIFRQHSPRNIDWFFEALGASFGVDYRLSRLNREAGTVVLRNKTPLAGPVKLIFSGKDALDSLITDSLFVEPFTGKTKVQAPAFPGAGSWESAAIAPVVPDYFMRDNYSRKKFRLRPFGGLNLSTDLWALPALGYNHYDGFMSGLAFHNISLPQNRLQFVVAPLYAWNSRQLAGTGILGYPIYVDQGSLRHMLLSLEAKSFHFRKSDLNVADPVFSRFIKLAPALTFSFRKPYPRHPVERQLLLKGFWISEDRMAFKQSPADSLYRPFNGEVERNLYGLLRYVVDNKRTLNPYAYKLEAQVGEHFAKFSVEGNLKIHYFHPDDKALHVRAYVGKLLPFSGASEVSRYHLTATYSGQNDYLYEETFFGRNETTGWRSNQISMREGGFKIHSLQYVDPLGRSDNWLAALNLRTDLPFGKLPLRLFADLAWIPSDSGPGEGILYAAGLELPLTRYASVYLPLVMSPNLNDYSKSILGKNRLLKMVSFKVNLSDIPWLNSNAALLGMR